MKKIIFFLFFAIHFNQIKAQFSSGKMDLMFNNTRYYKITNPDKNNFNASKEYILKKLDSLKVIYGDSSKKAAINKILLLQLKYQFIDTTQKVKDSVLKTIESSIYKTKKNYEYNYRDLELIEKYEKSSHPKVFFPAKQGRETLKFFESDTVHVEMFRNNFINYSPTEKRMILATEVVNDYFGPFRVGAGFQIKSDANTDSLSTADSTIKNDKKLNAISDLKNKGGDINLNVAFPFFQIGGNYSFISIRSSIFNNVGFSLPVFNKSTTDFVLTNYTGINVSSFARGILGKISLLVELSTGYTVGNKNFKNIITDANKNDPTSFWYNKASIGLDFKDAYRLQVDLYGGHSFIKNNFPATVTFIIRPSK